MADNSLFEQFDLNDLSLDNRIGLAPMTRTSATADGRATDAQAESWTRVVDAIHDAGSAVFAQLMHAGAQGQGNCYVDGTVAQSAYRPPGEMAELYGGSGAFPEADPLDAEGLAEVKAGFVASAERAAEVVSAVREATPDDFVVGVRASQAAVSDEERTWPDGEATAAAVFEVFTDAGADYIHVTEPEIAEPAFGDDGPTLTELAVEYGDAVVIANGGLADPEQARAALADGADSVTQATGALANHD